MVTENRVDFHLNYLFNFWNSVPKIAVEFKSYDEASQEDFFVDTYPLARDAYSCLTELRSEFTSEQEQNYQRLLDLIKKNEHHITAMKALYE